MRDDAGRKLERLNRPRPPAPQGGFSIRVDKSLFGARARSAVGELSEDLPGMAREMPARAMRLGPPPRAVRHPPRCALDVYARHGLWWRARGNASRQIVSDHSVCSLQRQGRRAASAVTVSCLASLEHEHTWLVLRHWLPTRASQHYSNRHHPCQSFLLCVAPPLAHLCVQGPRWTPTSRDSNMIWSTYNAILLLYHGQ